MLLFQNYANDWYNQEIKSINYTLFEKENVEILMLIKKLMSFVWWSILNAIQDTEELYKKRI